MDSLTYLLMFGLWVLPVVLLFMPTRKHDGEG